MMDYIVHNLFSTEAGVVWLVLKWVLVVLAAGFVGQFGKAFATYLMRRARESKEAAPQSLSETDLKGVLPERTSLQQHAPRGQAERTPAAAQPPAEQAVGGKEEKKQRKALAKQQKKALKSLKKFFK